MLYASLIVSNTCWLQGTKEGMGSMRNILFLFMAKVAVLTQYVNKVCETVCKMIFCTK